MSSDPNSDCKQCTESKLGWVHSAHTQGPRLHALYAQAAHTPICWAPCRGTLGAVSWPPQAVSQRALAMSSPRSRYKNCITTQILAVRTAHHVARAAARVATLQHRITGRWAPYRNPWRALCCDTRAALLSRYKPLYRDTP